MKHCISVPIRIYDVRTYIL